MITSSPCFSAKDNVGSGWVYTLLLFLMFWKFATNALNCLWTWLGLEFWLEWIPCGAEAAKGLGKLLESSSDDNELKLLWQSSDWVDSKSDKLKFGSPQLKRYFIKEIKLFATDNLGYVWGININQVLVIQARVWPLEYRFKFCTKRFIDFQIFITTSCFFVNCNLSSD